MDAEVLRDRLQAAVDAGAQARLHGPGGQFPVGNDFRLSGGALYPVTRVRVRPDGLIETGDGYEEWLIDPACVNHVSMLVKLYPEWEKHILEEMYT